MRARNAPNQRRAGHEHEHRNAERCGSYIEERAGPRRPRELVLHAKGARVLLRRLCQGGLLRDDERDVYRALDVRLPLIGSSATASSKRAPMRSWRLVAMLSISETVAWGTLYYSFGVLLRPFVSHFAATEATIAGAFSVALLGAAGAAWIVGMSIDRWGPRPVMTLSALLGVGALASLAAVDTVLGFYFAWAMIGVSHAGLLYEPAFAAVAKWFPVPKERARALLTLTTVAGFASTIFVPLTATLYEHFGRERTVLILAALAGLTVIPLNASLPREQSLAKPPTDRGISEGASTTASPRVVLLAIVFSLQAFASAGVTIHLVSHLRDEGIDLATAAKITGLMGAAQVPARLLFHVFQRFVGARARLPLLLGLQAVALVGVLGQDHAVVTVAALLLGAANGLLTLERAVVIADSFGTEQYGSVSGRIASFANATRAAGPVTVGLMKMAASSYTLAFLGLAAMTTLAAVVAWTSSSVKTTNRGPISCVLRSVTTSSK